MIRLSCGDNSIDLPNPELGNLDNYKRDVTVYVSRGGTIRTLKLNTSHKSVTKHLMFRSVLIPYVEQLRDFLIQCNGLYLTYTDYDSTSFTCFYVENTLQITNIVRGRCDFDLVLECLE